MFSIVNKHKRLLQLVLALVLLPPFAFFGLEAYTRGASGKDEVASVEGTSISEREFTEELARQQERVRQMFGGQADPALFDTPVLRKGVIDQMIAERVLATAAIKAHLMVDDDTLRNTIAAMPPFQVDGKFSREAYERVLRAQGLTPTGYQERLRYEMSLTQLARSVADTGFTARTALDRMAALETQQREVSEARISSESFAAAVKVDAAQVKAYYDANAAEFRVPERVKAQYLVLSASDLASRNPVSEAELKEAYQAKVAKEGGAEQRRASHILIPLAPGMKDSEKGAARAKAEQVLAELKKSPSRFAELAKKYSEDPGSKDKGGDLGFFSRGSMVKPFEDTAFSLKEGETSGIVESEFGFHIIRVTGVQSARLPTLESMRKELTSQAQAQKGARLFNEAASDFGNTVYEQSDSLEPAATKFKLTLQTSDWVDASGAGAAGVLANARLRAALFSADALQNKRNTDAVEVAPGTLAAAWVLEHQPATQRKFEDVRADIEKKLRLREAAKLAQKDGAAKLEALRKGENVSVSWSATRMVSRRNAQGVSPNAMSALAALDPAKLPGYAGVEAGDAGYVLYKVTRVAEPPAASDAQKSAESQQMQRMSGQLQYDAYLAALRGRSKVSINSDRIEKKAQQP